MGTARAGWRVRRRWLRVMAVRVVRRKEVREEEERRVDSLTGQGRVGRAVRRWRGKVVRWASQVREALAGFAGLG